MTSYGLFGNMCKPKGFCMRALLNKPSLIFPYFFQFSYIVIAMSFGNYFADVLAHKIEFSSSYVVYW